MAETVRKAGTGPRIGAVGIETDRHTAAGAATGRSGHRMAEIDRLMAAAEIGPSVRVMEIDLRVRLTAGIGPRAGIDLHTGVAEIGTGRLTVVGAGTDRRGLRIAGIGHHVRHSVGIGLPGLLMEAGETVRRVRLMVAIGPRVEIGPKVEIGRFGRARRTTAREIGRFGRGFRSRADSSAISALLG